MAGKLVVINDSNFEDITKEGTVLIDFWAEWCGPCKSQMPIVERLAEKVDGKAVVGKLDITDAGSSNAVGKLGIMSIPTLIVFRDGVEAQRFVGVQSEDKLLEAMGL